MNVNIIIALLFITGLAAGPTVTKDDLPGKYYTTKAFMGAMQIYDSNNEQYMVHYMLDIHRRQHQGYTTADSLDVVEDVRKQIKEADKNYFELLPEGKGTVYNKDEKDRKSVV